MTMTDKTLPIQLFDAASSTYTYVLLDADSRDALIIDPVDNQLERDLSVLRQYGLKLVWTLETHAHADHITSAGLLAEHAGAKTAAPSGCGIATAAVQLQDGDTLAFGQHQISAIHTPGHTAGSMCYLWQTDATSDTTHRAPAHLFTGDTLLINGCGRTDFQSGSAQDLYQSITRKLFTLPGNTTVWPGHDYKGNTQSTIDQERTHNPRLANKTEAEFVAIMNGLNLPRPKRMDEAVPANLASGMATSHAAEVHALDAGTAQSIAAQAPPLVPAVRPAQGYAGDITPQTAWAWVQAGDAVLVDVRTDAEREWVGFVPGAKPIAWKQWPGMAMNPRFDADLQAAAPQGTQLVLLCRSGVRSIAAAKRATELGLVAFNILEGFEGDPNSDAHRGQKGGWRLSGLPWRQG